MLDKQMIINQIDTTINHLVDIIDEVGKLGKPDAHELEGCSLDPEVIQSALQEGGPLAELLGAYCRTDKAMSEIRQEVVRLRNLRESLVGAFAGA